MQQQYLYELGDKALVFGLSWQPVVGTVTAQQARLLAKQRKRKQWVIAGQHFFAVGLAAQRVRSKKSTPVFSAAACHALLHPKGWRAAIYRLEQSVYWLAVVQEGTPMSVGDKMFSSSEQAQAVLQRMKEQHVTLEGSLEVQSIHNFMSVVGTHDVKKTAMQTVKRSLLLPVLYSLPLLFVVLWWHTESQPVEAAMVLPDVDPYWQHWQQRGLQPNGNAALQALLATWEHTPLDISGWQFKTVQCDAEQKQWRCVYEYRAQHEKATAIGIEQNLPEAWQVKTLQLDKAWLQAFIPYEVSEGKWLSAEQVRLQLLSQLQPIRPAFTALRLGEPVALLSAAAVSGKPNAHKYSPIYSQSLHFDGPMRSMALLQNMEEPLDWQRARLDHNPNAQVALKNSALQVSLQGVVYVRH